MQLFSSWTGSDFLLFYIALLGFCGLAAWWIPANLRPAGRRIESLEAEDLAVLAGGRERFADSVLADLYARGGLITTVTGKLEAVRENLPATPVGKALLVQDAPLSVKAAHRLLAVHGDRVAARLRRGGLLMRPDELTRLRWLSVTPFIALLLLGIYRQRAGSALGEPTGFLVILLVLTLAIGLVRLVKADPRTREGMAVLIRERKRSDRLARAPRAEEAGLAVALFGTAVLVGTPWEPVHAMRQQGGDSGGGGGDSSSDSGGGDGGSGCGGCGG